MADINDAFPSKYLKATDLGDDNVTVTIDRVDFEDIQTETGQKERKPILYFRGKQKGLVLNKTNASKISDLLASSDTDAWGGGKITLYATETTFQGRTMPCIRIKPAKAAAATSKGATAPAVEREPGADDDIPF